MAKLSGSNLWRLHILVPILQVGFFSRDLSTKGRQKNHGVAVLHHLLFVIVGFFFLSGGLNYKLRSTQLVFLGGGNLQMQIQKVHDSGQIIATSHDLGPQKVAKEGKSPIFQGNIGW